MLIVAGENPQAPALSDSPASENLWKSLGVFDQVDLCAESPVVLLR